MSEETLMQTLCTRIAESRNQKEGAQVYRDALRGDENVDCLVLNRAVIRRWSQSGLENVKRMAWKWMP